MQLTLRPYLTTGVVIAGAAALVVAPIQVMPPDITVAPTHAVSNVAIDQVALVTDVLNAINVLSVAQGDTAKIGIDVIAGLPLQLAVLSQAAITDPSLIPQLGSLLVYGFLNPGPAAGGPAFPPGVIQQFTPIVLSVAKLFPAPIGPTIVAGMITEPGLILTGFGKLGGALADGLSFIPAPNPAVLVPALGAAGLALATGAPRVFSFLTAFADVVGSVGEAVGGGWIPPVDPTAPPAPPPLASEGLSGWTGIQPTVLAAVLNQAIDDPSTIPGLASYLVYTLVAPPSSTFPPPLGPLGPFPGLPYPAGSYSLFVNVFGPIIEAAENNSPDPVSDAIVQASLKLNTLLTKGLNHLPAPDNPFIPGPPAAPMMLVAKAPADSGPAALPRPGALLRSTLSQNSLFDKDTKAGGAKPGDVIKSVAAHLPGAGKVNASDLIKAAQAKQKQLAAKVKDAVGGGVKEAATK